MQSVKHFINFLVIRLTLLASKVQTNRRTETVIMSAELSTVKICWVSNIRASYCFLCFPNHTRLACSLTVRLSNWTPHTIYHARNGLCLILWDMVSEAQSPNYYSNNPPTLKDWRTLIRWDITLFSSPVYLHYYGSSGSISGNKTYCLLILLKFVCC
jgi:hypothetical protein